MGSIHWGRRVNPNESKVGKSTNIHTKTVRSWNNGRILDHRRGFRSTWVPPALLLLHWSQGTDSVDSHPHCLTPSSLKVLTMTHPTSHLAFKPSYTIHSCHHFRIQLRGMSQALSISHILFSHRGPSPALTSAAAGSGWIQGPLGEWLLSLAPFWGISIVPTGHSLPALAAFVQGQMWNGHISGTAFVEIGNSWNPQQMPQKPLFCRRQKAVTVGPTAPLWAHLGCQISSFLDVNNTHTPQLPFFFLLSLSFSPSLCVKTKVV